MNPSDPSLELTWDPPANASGSGDVTTYHICFKLEGKESYDEMTVDGSTTSVVLTRNSGLVPQITYDLGVRAQSADDMGEWERLSTYIGIVYYHVLSTGIIISDGILQLSNCTLRT